VEPLEICKEFCKEKESEIVMRVRSLTMCSSKHNSKGFTLITTLMLLFLLSGLAIGMLMMVNTEVKVGTQDVQNNVSFHAAEGAIEKMTSDLSTALQTTLSPTIADIENLGANPGPPSIPGITFPASGYTLTPVTTSTACTAGQTSGCCPTGVSTPCISFSQGVVASGPYAGLNAQLMNVQLQATAQSLLGDEVNMNRTVELAFIPVFQFGIFSDSDLSFFAGPNFNFGGRVHTNGDLYLAEGSGNTLTFQSQVSAYGNIIRAWMANAEPLSFNGSTGTVVAPTAASGCSGSQPACKSFTSSPDDGSVTGPIPPPVVATASLTQNGSWQTISLTTFGGLVIDGDYGNASYGTGATDLTLPFVNGANVGIAVGGAQQYEIIRRPPSGEVPTSPLGASRLYNQAQIRVLLSDNPNELPCGNPSTPPPCGGANDAQNIRLANFSNPSNGNNFSYGVQQYASGGTALGTQTMYFATANSAIPNPNSGYYEYPTATEVSTDWQFGPLYPFPTGTQTITDPVYNPAQAPYMSTISATSPAVYQTPPPDYLVLCNPSGVSTVSVTSSTQPSSPPSPPYCPGMGQTGTAAVSYPFYSIGAAPTTGTSGSPALTLPFGYQSTASGASAVTYSTANLTSWNLLDGYLRVEYQDSSGNYHPVTQEWLQLGFARSVVPPTGPGGASGADPISPNAILRLQEPAFRNVASTTSLPNSTGTPPAYTYPAPTKTGSGSSTKWTYTYTATPGQPPAVVADSNSGSAWFGVTSATSATAGQPSPSQYNWYPINFYDPREGEVRDNATGDNSCTPNGVMNAVELDEGNLKRWLAGTIGASGSLVNSQNQNGFVLYFSDRRGMLPNPNGTAVDPANTKTGDSGLEDVINSASATGTPNGQLEPDPPNKSYSPEDVNLNGALDNFGAGNLGLALGYNLTVPTASVTTFTAANNINKVVNSSTYPDPYMVGSADRISNCAVTQNAWVSGARHALKLIDASLGNVPLNPGGAGGFTVGSENPVYVFGNYNSNSTDPTWTGGADAAGMAAAGIVADALTLLSNDWVDFNSFMSGPTNLGNRVVSTNTFYRMAVAAGKNINFPYPSACPNTTVCNTDFGTDGGVHNFLRYVENWGCCSLYYKGSIASLYYATYNTGIYKCCNIVYSPPTRIYGFDSDFTTPAGLPPGTPTFRDIDNLSYRQSFTPCTVGANGLCTN